MTTKVFIFLNSIIEHMPSVSMNAAFIAHLIEDLFRTSENVGFILLLFSSILVSQLTKYRKQIFILLFQRLQNSKTTKFIKSGVKSFIFLQKF